MNGLRKFGLYVMEFYSAIRKNETMWFEGKWMQLEDIMLSEVSQAQKDKDYVCIVGNRHNTNINNIMKNRLLCEATNREGRE
jgi:hypothetical protein